MKIIKIPSTIATFFLYIGLSAQPGSPDNTFGTGGKVITDVSGNEDNGNAIAIQSDGKILVAGNTTMNGASYDCAIVRYNPDGSLDNSFGKGGKVVTDYGGTIEDYLSIVIQSNGKIIVAGSSIQGARNADFILARYNSDGSLDNTFGSGGKVISDFGPNDSNSGSALAIQADGKILVGGQSNSNATDEWYDMALVRYENNGSLDKTFGTGGIVTTDFGYAQNEYCNSIIIQNDGRIVLAGSVNSGSPNYSSFALARLNTNGTMDNSFDSDGRVITDFGPSQDRAKSMVMQTDGKIVVVGISENNSSDIALVRYNSNGSPDITFDSDGKLITSIGTYTDDGNALGLQSDGKIIVGGTSSLPGGSNGFALLRYNSDGSLDNNFGSGGKVTSPVAKTASANALSIQSDGKILLAGTCATGETLSSSDFALVRYQINSTSSIWENHETAGFTIFPNPCDGKFFLTNLKGADRTIQRISVFNFAGEKIYDENNCINNTYEFNLSAYPKGLYFMEIKSGMRTIFNKIIVE